MVSVVCFRIRQDPQMRRADAVRFISASFAHYRPPLLSLFAAISSEAREQLANQLLGLHHGGSGGGLQATHQE